MHMRKEENFIEIKWLFYYPGMGGQNLKYTDIYGCGK